MAELASWYLILNLLSRNKLASVEKTDPHRVKSQEDDDDYYYY
jgi:hypothetical protein